MSIHRCSQTGSILWLDCNHFDLWSHIFNVSRHPRSQTAAADRDEYRIDWARHLPKKLHGHRSLPGNDLNVIEGVQVGVAELVNQLLTFRKGFIKTVAMKNDLRTSCLD